MRNYKPKTDRPCMDPDKIKKAISMVKEDNRPILEVSKLLNIPRRSLTRYLKSSTETFTFGYSKHRKVFNVEQESELAEYLHKSADIYFGLSPIEVRKLAHSYALRLKIERLPAQWHEKKMSGCEGFASFLKRHSTLAIRKPEATSLARTSSFNKQSFDLFLNNLRLVLDREKISHDCIWNMDETGVTTVPECEKIVGRRVQKQTGAVVSAERGVLVTVAVAVAVSALGNSIPPFFVFPRVNVKQHFLTGVPLGSSGTGNKSGWMTDSGMDLFMDHFNKFNRPSKERPVLLLLDNHSSHMSIGTLNLAKNNHVHLLSFPAHCFHKLQSLNFSVYGPLKKFNATAGSNWIRNNPGKTMSINDVPGIVSHSLPLAVTPSNILAGFRKAGIMSFDPEGFNACADYVPGFVTDRPNPEQVQEQVLFQIDIREVSEPFLVLEFIFQEIVDQEPAIADPFPHELFLDSPDLNTNPVPLEVTTPVPSDITESSRKSPLEELRPFPKAEARKNTKDNGRRKRTSAVLTDTPIKEVIEAKKEAVKAKATKKLFPEDKRKKKTVAAKKKCASKKRVRKNKNQLAEEYHCLECGMSYSSSKVDWVKCTVKCELWACVKCVENNEKNYICSDWDSSVG